MGNSWLWRSGGFLMGESSKSKSQFFGKLCPCLSVILPQLPLWSIWLVTAWHHFCFPCLNHLSLAIPCLLAKSESPESCIILLYILWHFFGYTVTHTLFLFLNPLKPTFRWLTRPILHRCLPWCLGSWFWAGWYQPFLVTVRIFFSDRTKICLHHQWDLDDLVDTRFGYIF